MPSLGYMSCPHHRAIYTSRYLKRPSRQTSSPISNPRPRMTSNASRLAFLCEDAVVCARVYGYCDGTVVEFCLGIACIVIATVSLYIAGMLRDRRR